MKFETIKLQTDGAVAELTLNRPQVLNALNGKMRSELLQAFKLLGTDKSVKALLITGAGPGFCAGADLTEGGFDPSGPKSIGTQVRDGMLESVNPMIQALWDMEVPTIAAVNGVAAGGGVGLALGCDIVLAARSSKFIQVFIPKLGIIPDIGVSWHLPRLVGRARALGLGAFGDPLDAETAERWGLIWGCVDDDRLMDSARDSAKRLSNSPTAALVQARRAFDQAPANSLAQQLSLEAETQRRLCDEPAFIEGVMKFINKA